MLKNYLKIALRNLRKRKGYAFINVVGLAIGMTCCLLILLYVVDELRYDRFHEHADDIYRLRVERFSSGGEAELTAAASAPMLPAALQDFPQIAAGARLAQRTYLVERGTERFYEERFFWADSSMFDVFTFPFVAGNPTTALARPYSVVLTASTAKKYFGDQDPIGQVLTIEDWDLTVTGVVQDVPVQSHFSFDFLGSFSTIEVLEDRPSNEWNWWSLGYYTYLRIGEGVDVAALQEQLREMPSRYIGDQEEVSGYRQFLYLQPLTDIHLHSDYRAEIEPNSDIAYVYVFSAIAVFILLIACINFMNLATARSAQRAREVGLRKVVGAGKHQLIGQFLGESILMSLFALLLSLVLIQLLLPLFSQLAFKTLTLNYIKEWPYMLLAVGFAVIVGVLAGSYPAFALSAFRPAQVLKGDVVPGGRAAMLRKGLVVFQFAISVFLIAGSLVVFQQLQFMRTQNLGFQKEQMVVLNVRNNQEVVSRYESVERAMNGLPSVLEATFSSSVPGRSNYTNVISRQEGMTDDGQTMGILGVDYDFIDTYSLELAAGRGFSREMGTDTSAFVINEATMKAVGWQTPDEAIGQNLTRQFGDTRTVIGVVKDFNFASLQHTVEPLVLQLQPSWFNYITLRISTENVPEAMASISNTWNTFSPGRPVEYFFLDDDYDRQYRTEERISQILGLFTVLAIFIACLGLFGLASFTAEQRTKEIGVRKVLGASVSGIVALLSRDFLKLILVAFVVATPIAYFIMHRWLQDFAYHIAISWTTFALAGGTALGIALLTVSYQSVKAALADPVKSLRYE
ncbi:MAG TPA: ABC transporter permease [Rhodothermales bacterium]|nr:ABC transporter permease [Rhodothermales bacterium]